MGTTNPTRAAGSQFSGTNQFTNIVPEKWDRNVKLHFFANTTFASIVNHKYEPQFDNGDTIHIRKTGLPTIQSYTRNSAVTPETMTSTKETFTIDQQKYFCNQIDDLDNSQIDIPMLEEYTKRYGEQLALEVDAYLEGIFIAGSDGTNDLGTSGTPIAITPSNVYTTFVQMSNILSKTNTLPLGKNPVIIAPSDLVACIRLCTEVAGKSTPLGDSVVRKGDTLGTFGGLDVVRSTRITATNGVYSCVCCTNNEAVTMANKVKKLKRVDMGPALKFGQAVMALYFYGAKVMYPEMIGILYCTVAFS